MSGIGYKEKVGAVLVVGGGIAGIQSSLDLAEMGFKVFLLEKGPAIGGKMSQLDKTFPTNDCAICILSPKLVEAGRHHNIQIITLAEIDKVEGESGNFMVTLKKQPRYIDESKCTGCGLCSSWCPIDASSEYDEGLRKRKSIFIRYPQAIPKLPMIDKSICIGCRLCEFICEARALDFTQQEELIDVNVGAIILAKGSAIYDPTSLKQYGYGQYSNVITSSEFERVLSASGPFQGHVLRPSDGKGPHNVAWIQCVGSRDRKIGNNYCSAVCCMYALKESIIAKEHAPELECHIFFMDIRVTGKGFEEYSVRAQEDYDIKFHNARISYVEEDPLTKEIILYYEDKETGGAIASRFDLVVLSTGYQPSQEDIDLCKKLGIQLNEHNFCAVTAFKPLETNVPGVFACGTFSGPKDIPETVAEASAVASKASGLLASERNKLTTKKKYPPEIQVVGEDPRIGVFVCHCGINIGGVVDVPDVVDYVKDLPNVIYAERNIYTCSQDTQDKIKEIIKEKGINRVIVASCTPRTHESLFQNTIREAGLNRYLFELVNIREHCSWVHMREPDKATNKAKELVAMTVAKSKLLQPVHEISMDITQSGVVIGGGIAGMTAALELANQGYTIHLIEKEAELGGLTRKIHYILEDEDPQLYLKKLIIDVSNNDKITTLTSASIEDITGYVGNYNILVKNQEDSREIEAGIIIVATGGLEHKPNEFLYGKDERILTQQELEQKINRDKIKAKSVVMIQCVGSRNKTRPYCSKICCSVAIKNALKLKVQNPRINISILYRDIRTYGFKEEYYEKARVLGINFFQYNENNPPEIKIKKKQLQVSVFNVDTQSKMILTPNLVGLSTPIVPPENKDLAQMLKVPLDQNGFFLEAHAKLRPLDFATDGIFLCGAAQWPKFMNEAIAQARGAAARATTILSKEKITVIGATARVNEDLCIGCGSCQEICPYNAIQMQLKEKKLERTTILTYQSHVLEAACKGCGACSAACPVQAITVPHFTNTQILEMVRSLTRKEAKNGT